MRILMLSKCGQGLGIGVRLMHEGNDVKMWVNNPLYAQCGDGIIDRVTEWRPHITWADLVICDGPGLGHLEETIRGLGKAVLGCSEVIDLVTEDRGKLRQLLDKIGNPCSNASTSMEVVIEGWFNGRAWMSPFFLTFNDKRMMDQNLGLDVGCAGCITIAVDDGRIIDDTIKRITIQLQKFGYRGPISMLCSVSDGNINAIDCIPGFRYDTIFTVLEGIKESVTDLLFESANGLKKNIQIGTDFIISVKASVPPWPYVIEGMGSGGVKIEGLNKHNLKHIFLGAVKIEDEQYVCAGGDNMIIRVTAKGRTIREARNRAYRTLNNIDIPNVQYRTDIGQNAEDHIMALRNWGLI